jgi:phosphorylcholine metabolism protein LicD
MISPGSIRFLSFVLSSPRQRLISILSKNKQVVRHICDILLNILLLNIRVNSSVINKLKKHKRVIYLLVDKKTTDKTRAELLTKHLSITKTILPLLKAIETSLKNEPLYQDVSNKRRR